MEPTKGGGTVDHAIVDSFIKVSIKIRSSFSRVKKKFVLPQWNFITLLRCLFRYLALHFQNDRASADSWDFTSLIICRGNGK